MTVGRVTEITAISPTSFEDAIREAVAGFSEQFRGVREAWLKESRVIIEDGNVVGFQVNLMFTFVREEAPAPEV